MEIYILDPLLRREKVIDKFESLIWTERWQAVGDFELELKSTLENRSDFTTGTKLAINNSYRVMVVETVEDKITDGGEFKLKITGRSLEKILEDRIYKDSLASFTDPMILEGMANVIAEDMFSHICRSPGALSPYDEIPFLQEGSIYPPNDLFFPQLIIRWEQRVATLYDAIRGICSAYDLGFRLVRNFDTSELYFDVYTGTDRTSGQPSNTPVVFDYNLDNLRESTEFTSVQKAKNVAYVFSEGGYAVIYGKNVDEDVDGFDRKVMLVNAPDDPAAPSWAQVMEQAGDEALRNARPIALFDGEVDQRSAYVYDVDYRLGDYVEMRNKDGVVTYKRVTEQILVEDSNGERSYPTLSGAEFTDLGSTWFSYGVDPTVWADFDASAETWSDM